eukprot:750968-Hanusia_phi.AAC.1
MKADVSVTYVTLGSLARHPPATNAIITTATHALAISLLRLGFSTHPTNTLLYPHPDESVIPGIRCMILKFYQ